MPSEDTEILEFSQYQKSDKAPFIVYGDLECIIEKTDRFKNNPENSSVTKISEHIPQVFSMSAILLFKSIENKHEYEKVSMKKFCKSLRKHAMNMIKFKKKKNEVINKRAAGII